MLAEKHITSDRRVSAEPNKKYIRIAREDCYEGVHVEMSNIPELIEMLKTIHFAKAPMGGPQCQP